MEVFVLKDYEEVSKKAFEVMKSVVSAKPDAVLGLATGSSGKSNQLCTVPVIQLG